MKRMTMTGLVCLVSAITLLSGKTCAAEDRPFIAIWRDSEGLRISSEVPYLRIAIWEDGRIWFGAETNKWNHNLREGRLEPERVAQLKKALAGSGVFDLKRTSYLVPDAAVDCVMVDLGDKQQILYWDEVETRGYGININPGPEGLEFIKCWKEVNRLALAAIPAQSQPRTERFQRPPESWHLKKPAR